MNYNRTMLAGRVTKDIELRYTPKGTAVADIALAINRVIKNEAGDKTEEATFVDVTLWGKTAEIASKYSGKGKALHIEGRLHMDKWTDKESGQNRTKLKVVGENIQLIRSQSDGKPATTADVEVVEDSGVPF